MDVSSEGFVDSVVFGFFFFFFFLSTPPPLSFRAPPLAAVYSEDGIVVVRRCVVGKQLYIEREIDQRADT